MKAKVIMLPTDKEVEGTKEYSAEIYQYYDKLYYKTDCNYSLHEAQPFHLYLIDPNAEIKVGDYYIMEGVLMNPVNDQGEADRCNNDPIISEVCSKIIATTDKELWSKNKIENSDHLLNQPLPQLSEQSIKLLVDYYNQNGTMPDEVEVEYPIAGYAPGRYRNRCITCSAIFTGDKRAVQCEKCAIKMTNIIDITIPEEKMYSLNEVQELINEFHKDFCYGTGTEDLKDEWLSKNL